MKTIFKHIRFLNRWTWKVGLGDCKGFHISRMFKDECLCPIYIYHNGYTYVPFGWEIESGFGRGEDRTVHITILNFDFRWNIKKIGEL